MNKGLNRINLTAADIKSLRRADNTAEGDLRSAEAPEPMTAEAAARSFLSEMVAAGAASAGLGGGPQAAVELGDEPLRGAVDAPGAGPVTEPDLVTRGERHEAITRTEVVSFEQVKDDIPVFGSRVTVEVDDNRDVVSASMNLAPVEGVPTEPAISAEEATQSLRGHLQDGAKASLPIPALSILPNPGEDGALRLTWHFAAVSAMPAETGEVEGVPDTPADMGGCCADVARASVDFDYFIDANDGSLLYQFPNAAFVDIPTRCRGQDEEGQNQVFFGRIDGPEFAMENPFEDIRTFDLGLNPIETAPFPAQTIRNSTSDWQNTHPAAVSAHVNATRVLDFLFRILRRNSIDDDGMTLENVVNCTSQSGAGGNEWINAVWWRGKMWYGQQAQPGGGLVSLSRYLDIIAHELFHGVTEHTCKLVYSGLSGALNESLSDIFGVIIRNWHLAPAPGDVATWNWDIGSGLGAGGNPLRNMAQPSSVGRWWRPNPAGGGAVIVNGYPDHMNDYVPLPVQRAWDWGGVHWFSNIHNFAAHKVLTATRADGTHVFSPEEVAILYYLVQTRLGRLADFSDARAELLAVSDVVYGGNAARQAEARAAIESAYDAVGIT